MKKVLFLVESLSGGGAEKVLLTFIKNLNKEKYNITIYSIVRTGIYVDDFMQYCKVKSALNDYSSYGFVGKLFFRLKIKLIYLLSPKLVYRYLIREKYDIEIAFIEGFSTKIISNSNNKDSKKYAWIHIDMINRNYADKYYKSLEEHKKSYNKFNKVVCVSNQVKAQYEKKFKLNNHLVLYNPVEKNEIRKFSKEYCLTKKIIFYAVGRLEYQKGFDRLIEIFSEIKDIYNFELHILGTGSLEKDLTQEINKLNLKDKVFLEGFKKNPYSNLVNAHMLICSSRAEGFSLVIAEAMCLGIPILTTDCAGPAELIDNGKFGYLVDNSKNDLKKGIIDILEKPDLLYKYHELSNRRAIMFDIKKIIDKVEELLDE